MRYLFIVAFFLFTTITALAQTPTDSLISALKAEIKKKDEYVKRRQSRIEKLQDQLTTSPSIPLSKQFDIYNGLYHLYKTFIYDSAFRYSQKLIQTAYLLNDPQKIAYARVKLGFILISSGMFKETFDSLKMVKVGDLADSNKVDYYGLLARAYNDLNDYNNDQHYRRVYNSLDLLYTDSALKWCDPESYDYYHLQAARASHTGNPAKTMEIAQHMLKNLELTEHQLAMNYFDMSSSSRAMDDEENSIRYTILSAMADIRAATKETLAMYTLAGQLFEAGDVHNAYLFILQAQDDADFYGARQRKVKISSLLPLIASAELNSSESRRLQWVRYGVGLSVLLAMVIIFLIIIFKQLKKIKAADLKIRDANDKLQETNQKLLEANKIKEEYIGYYFAINSEYLDKIEHLKKSVDQKLIHKKYDDIRFIVNNINSKRDRDELYHSFDKVFIKLFPDFVRTFNSYLKPEEQFVLKDGQLLNTELRIFALIRMGITESEDIARILNYSVNTIYAYKTKIRNKSILPNEVFDQKIMEIKAI